MSRALFVSDIHISSEDDPKCALFLRVLDHVLAQGFSHLFLVGDIFDLWISDRRYFVERYPTVIAKIRALKRAGVHIHYFEGNHDLDLRPFWQHQLGVDVHSEAAYFNLDGLHLRVEHGDQMDPDDRGYIFLRWLLRTPVLVWLERNLPNWLVVKIGERASRSSRAYTSQIKIASDEEARAKILRHALKVACERPIDLFISGHVHACEDSLQLAQGREFRCINLGTWLKEPMAFELNNGVGKMVPGSHFGK